MCGESEVPAALTWDECVDPCACRELKHGRLRSINQTFSQVTRILHQVYYRRGRSLMIEVRHNLPSSVAVTIQWFVSSAAPTYAITDPKAYDVVSNGIGLQR